MSKVLAVQSLHTSRETQAIGSASRRRPSRTLSHARIGLCSLAAWGAVSAARAQPTFQITTIPLLPGATASHAEAVNNLGQTVGWARITGTNYRAFLFDPATGMVTDLGPLNNLGAGGDTSGPKAINDLGEVVGTFTHLPSGRPHAFYWHGAGIIDITTPPSGGSPFSGEARGITPAGLIVGLNDLACGSPNAFSRCAFWSSPAGPAQIADLAGQCGSSYPIYAVNASNAMLGRDSILINGLTWFRPVVTTLPGSQVMLPTWDGSFVGHGNAMGINATGIVCGNSEDRTAGTSHACFWIGTSINVLHGLGNDVFDEALSVNDSGDIVGKSFPGNQWRAVIWPGLSPTALDLQTLLTNSTTLTLGTANKISNTGFIAVNANIVGPNAQAALLSPCTPAFLAAPLSVIAPPGATVSFTATAVGAGPILTVWSRVGGGTLTDGPTPGGSVISGATTTTLTITGITAADAGSYLATATTPCGSAASAPATLTYCPADFNSDGFIDFFDYDDFVFCFETGTCAPGTTADFNDDGFVDFFDYDAFVAAFEAGC